MIKHLSAERKTDIEKMGCIRQRNKCIKKKKYSIVDGGTGNCNDLVVVGTDHKDAAEYLETCIVVSADQEEQLTFKKRTEEIYDVQVWNATDLNLAAFSKNEKNRHH